MPNSSDAEIKVAFDQIDRALFDFFRDNHVEPTHILFDPHMYARLAHHSERWRIAYVDANAAPPIVKLFNLTVLQVFQPYPFVAVARLMTIEGGS